MINRLMSHFKICAFYIVREEISTKNSEDAYSITGYPRSTPFDEVFSRIIQMVSNREDIIKSVPSTSELHMEQHTRAKQIKKRVHHRSRTDKTRFNFTCPKCSDYQKSKTFDSTQNLFRHLEQVHNLDNMEYPSSLQVMDFLDNMSWALNNSILRNMLLQAVKWRVIVQGKL